VFCLAQLPETRQTDAAPDQGQQQQQLVRFRPYSPGVAPLRAGNEQDEAEARPSAEAIRAMQALEVLATNKHYTELRADVDQSVRMIRDSANSLHNALEICGALVAELYNQGFLHVLTE
jgi:hypothetical protein